MYVSIFNYKFLIFLTIFLQHIDGQVFLEFDSNYYYIEIGLPVKSYVRAERVCRSLNSTLAIIRSKDDHDFLMRQIGNFTDITVQSKFFYIGLKKEKRRYMNDTYYWNDGTSLAEAGFSRWCEGEPRDVHQSGYCVAIQSSRLNANGTGSFCWRAARCTKWLSYYICKKEREAIRTVAAFDDISSAAQPTTIVPKSLEIQATTSANENIERTQSLLDSMFVSNHAVTTATLDTGFLKQEYFYLIIGLGSLNVVWILVLIIVVVVKKRKRRFLQNHSQPSNSNIYSDIQTRPLPPRLEETEDVYLRPVTRIKDFHSYEDIPTMCQAIRQRPYSTA